MWLFQNNSFLSIVAHRDKPGRFLVRARINGDIERAIPNASVEETPNADYRYRTEVGVFELVELLESAAKRIDYPNFKASVSDPQRERAYHDVWGIMRRAYSN